MVKYFIDKVYKVYRLRDEMGEWSVDNKTVLEFVSIHEEEEHAVKSLLDKPSYKSYVILPSYMRCEYSEP
jgi:hypothetical protein